MGGLTHCSPVQRDCPLGVHFPASADGLHMQRFPDCEIWRVLSTADEMGAVPWPHRVMMGICRGCQWSCRRKWTSPFALSAMSGNQALRWDRVLKLEPLRRSMPLKPSIARPNRIPVDKPRGHVWGPEDGAFREASKSVQARFWQYSLPAHVLLRRARFCPTHLWFGCTHLHGLATSSGLVGSSASAPN